MAPAGRLRKKSDGHWSRYQILEDLHPFLNIGVSIEGFEQCFFPTYLTIVLLWRNHPVRVVQAFLLFLQLTTLFEHLLEV